MNYTKSTYYPISDAAHFFSVRQGKIRFEEPATGKRIPGQPTHSAAQPVAKNLSGKRQMISMEHI